MRSLNLVPWFTLLLTALVLGPVAALHAEESDVPAIVVPTGEGVGGGTPLAADAWAKAHDLPVGTVGVPRLAAAPEGLATRPLRPQVRVLAVNGRLHVRADVPEPPGVGMGLSILLAPDARAKDGASTPAVGAADAVALAYAPQDLQGPRYVVRGPRGVGRTVYRVDGWADVGEMESWAVELSVPFADLGVDRADTAIAAAVVVRSRLPGLVAWAPATAAFTGPAAGTWLRLEPGPEGWPSAPVDLDPTEAERAQWRADEDRADEERLYFWNGFLFADSMSPSTLLAAAGKRDVLPVNVPRDELRALVQEFVVAPLDRIVGVRPDLAFPHVVKGHVYADLGLDADALEAFAAAQAVVPGLLEASAGAWLEVKGPSLARLPVGAPTDYRAATARADEALANANADAPPPARDGVLLGRALLDHLRGAFSEADTVLQRLAATYPTQPGVVLQSERTHLCLAEWPRERQYRAREEQQDNLPRVALNTTKGEVVLELFEDDVPNTVKNFVWLVEQGFYDGTTLGYVVPFLGWVGGEGRDAPPWAIPAESSEKPGRRRRLFRGTVAMVSPDPEAVAASFLVTTGTAVHLDGAFSAFGRVVEGLGVVEAVTAEDRILEARVVRKRAATDYRPVTVDGGPAPELR